MVKKFPNLSASIKIGNVTFRNRRKKVAVVEMRNELAPDANVRHRPLLLKEIADCVEVHTG